MKKLLFYIVIGLCYSLQAEAEQLEDKLKVISNFHDRLIDITKNSQIPDDEAKVEELYSFSLEFLSNLDAVIGFTQSQNDSFERRRTKTLSLIVSWNYIWGQVEDNLETHFKKEEMNEAWPYVKALVSKDLGIETVHTPMTERISEEFHEYNDVWNVFWDHVLLPIEAHVKPRVQNHVGKLIKERQEKIDYTGSADTSVLSNEALKLPITYAFCVNLFAQLYIAEDHKSLFEDIDSIVKKHGIEKAQLQEWVYPAETYLFFHEYKDSLKSENQRSFAKIIGRGKLSKTPLHPLVGFMSQLILLQVAGESTSIKDVKTVPQLLLSLDTHFSTESSD